MAHYKAFQATLQNLKPEALILSLRTLHPKDQTQNANLETLHSKSYSPKQASHEKAAEVCGKLLGEVAECQDILSSLNLTEQFASSAEIRDR